MCGEAVQELSQASVRYLTAQLTCGPTDFIRDDVTRQPPGERTRELGKDERVRTLAGVRGLHQFLLTRQADPSPDLAAMVHRKERTRPVEELAVRRRAVGKHPLPDGCR